MPQSIVAQRILESAATLFARQGFRLTTTRDIALHAKINQATLFRHFKNGKHELSLAAIDHLAKACCIQDKLEKAYRRCDPSQPQTIEVVFQVCFGVCALHPAFVNIVANAIVEKSDPGSPLDLSAAVRDKYTLPIGSFIETFCVTAVKAGTMTGDGMVNARLLVGILVGNIHHSIIRGNDFPKDLSQAENLAHTVVYIWLNGCAGRPEISSPTVESRMGEPRSQSSTVAEIFQELRILPSTD